MDRRSDKEISKRFEEDFLGIPLQRQITHCDHYAIAPLFMEQLQNHQPILEAGCGSGRWCAWFRKQGWESVGLDWSEALCARARNEIDGVTFVSGDIQDMPFPDHSFGSVVALGSIEHVPEGPLRALKEFNRVLKAEGVAIITVPYGGVLRRLIRRLSSPLLWMKSLPFIRHWLHKQGADGTSLFEAKKGCRSDWFPQYFCSEAGWGFFQYEFNLIQMRGFLKEAGFSIEREFVSFADEGILHNFGRMAAHWDDKCCCVRLNLLGRMLQRILPLKYYGHMLCFLVHRT
ncbi:MAG: class I SAM-dependent methyltransferase [Kiritimatiellae bacterium]|nr:class I SAM-dependent methyltransferase [Kiritimatiellia bacterium]